MTNNNQHGEASGWYDYDAGANTLVNKLCTQYESNAHLPVRTVQSNQYSYKLVWANNFFFFLFQIFFLCKQVHVMFIGFCFNDSEQYVDRKKKADSQIGPITNYLFFFFCALL